MDDKQKNQLMSVLRDAIELETEITTQNKMLKELSKIKANKIPELHLEPKLDTSLGTGIMIMWGILGIFGLISLIISFYLGGGYLAFAVICFLICIIVTACKTGMNRNKCEMHDKENAKRKAIYYREIEKGDKFFNEIESTLNALKASTMKTLQNVYKTELIYPKYRYLSAVAAFYEYFITGRCDDLIGPHGAYNLYEYEMRKDGIILSGETVENPALIMFHHYILSQQLSIADNNTTCVAKELEFAAEKTQLHSLDVYQSHMEDVISRISAEYGTRVQ